MERIKVKEAAELLGVSEQYIRLGMQRGQLPIGSCVKLSSKWTYHISRGRIEAYLSEKDIKNLKTVAATTAERTNNYDTGRTSESNGRQNHCDVEGRPHTGGTSDGE